LPFSHASFIAVVSGASSAHAAFEQRKKTATVNAARLNRFFTIRSFLERVLVVRVESFS
jgi:hypothetical protein